MVFYRLLVLLLDDDGLLVFADIFNSVSKKLSRWEYDNERLCAAEPRLRLKSFPLPAGIEHGRLA